MMSQVVMSPTTTMPDLVCAAAVIGAFMSLLLELARSDTPYLQL